MNLLVVDWDFFFPIVERPHQQTYPGEMWLYDWGHSEGSAFMLEGIWPIRASSFYQRAIPLPTIDTAAWKAFVQQVKVRKGTTLYYADSNVYALSMLQELTGGRTIRRLRKPGRIVLIDAHHDCGYKGKQAFYRSAEYGTFQFTCEDWLVGYVLSGFTAHMRYPAWRAHALEKDGEPQPIVTLDRGIYSPEEPMPIFDAVFVCRSGAWVAPWCDTEFQQFLAAFPVSARKRVGPCKMRLYDDVQVKALASQELAIRVNAMSKKRGKQS